MLPSATLRHIQQSRPVKYLGKFIPAVAQKMFKGDVFTTNRENREFLSRYNLEPYNDRVPVFAPNASVRQLAKNANAMFGFSKSYYIHPYQLHYFDVKGHPLVATTRSTYVRKIRNEPLWIILTSVAVQSPVVRSVARTRVIRAIHQHLEKRGFDKAPGRGPSREIRGTLWIILHNPIKSLRVTPDEFGSVIAEALDTVHGQRIGGLQKP